MKKYALIISVIFYLFFIGCVDFTQNKNTALPDIFLYGLYGEEIEEYNYNDFLYGEGIMGEKIACSYDKCVYVKLDDTIYEIDGNDLKYVCKHNEHIFSLVGCNNCCFAYIASNPSAIRRFV